MKRIGQLVFLGAASLALALYALTAPEGLPWNASTHLALAYLGEVVRLPVMPHPIWGCYVQVFGGAVGLSAVMAAVAAGLVAVLVNRHFGWRFAVSAALVWIFMPGVWNRAITGERGVCLASMAVVAAWAANWIAERLWRKLKAISEKASGGAQGLSALPSAHEVLEKRGKINRIAGWGAMGTAGILALVSLTLHDYRYGEAAGVFARGVVEEAGERCIVLSGVCDDQVVVESKSRVEHSSTSHVDFRTVSLRNDDAYRTRLAAWVRSAFPTETNLWVAAQVGAAAFVEAASRKHPERFYLMGGKSTTPEAWEGRWGAFEPYLGSSDPFVRVARRAFAAEGNAVANAMLDGGEEKGGGESRWTVASDDCAKRHAHCQPPPAFSASSATAWRLYKRIYNQIDPGNFSALVNMHEMIRRGYVVSGDERKNVQEALEKFFKVAFNREHAREIARAAGPIRADPAFFAKMAEEAKRRIAAKIAAGEKVEPSPEILSLVEWNNEMVRCMNKGEVVKAGRIARAILSNPKWRDFIPANAVLGSLAASEGDYVTSEAFFRVVADVTNAVPAIVLNDYADVLIRLGKLEEAEQMARRAVKGSGESLWIARLTLAEVLERREREKVKVEGDEIRALLKSVLKYAPAKVRDKVRKEHKGYVR